MALLISIRITDDPENHKVSIEGKAEAVDSPDGTITALEQKLNQQFMTFCSALERGEIIVSMSQEQFKQMFPAVNEQLESGEIGGYVIGPDGEAKKLND
jgi:hypothetical protein